MLDDEFSKSFFRNTLLKHFQEESAESSVICMAFLISCEHESLELRFKF